jgi:deaminated glutathione amidase
MRIAVGQILGGTDKAANLAEIRAMADAAANRGADLVAFPEHAMFKQPIRDDTFFDAVEDLDGPYVGALREVAQRHRLAVIAGMAERIPGERRAYNTDVVVSPDGELLATYRKIHLYDAFGGAESSSIRPGELDQPLTVRIGDLTWGLMTCYDIRFPEHARLLVDQGAEAIVIPTAWTPGPRKEDHWSVLVRARAIENVAFVVAPGIAAPLCTGGSLVVDPMGVVLAELGEGPGLAVADLTRERLEEVRRRNPALDHRRIAVGVR